MTPSNPAAEFAVRSARAAFNRALAEADLGAIGPLLARDVVLITGSDSGVVAGRQAQLIAWKREFSARPRTVYVRTTQSVTASTIEPIALEQGIWEGTIEGQGTLVAGGVYSAKWRQTDGAWRLIAEIFVTLR
ncbi:nuclear transport factor 2 family protein [Novosphingobium olei]|uniref:Nuclear transport factor 2 family protein n=1 Tax=Novosphingobium olei TaxID=2728851 RepID=A0A7Y0GA62_9SPHN|nr:nuclear transport factor 2 family protein [Novosphingobium olei]NML94926.1 nuclear transport factor 2 family protein [Novosphingobium olei]